MEVLEWQRVQWISSQAHNVLNSNPDEFDTIPLQELEMADTQLGAYKYHADFRLLIRNKIDQLRQRRDNAQGRNIRFFERVITFLGGAAVTLIGVFAQHYISSVG